jgi:PAS domain S-box-containing protein
MNKANILIIDDTPENLNLLSEILIQQGYKVRSVTKGSSGIRGAQAAPPDLILLDVNMPEMNGYEVCQQLKASDRTQDIPVIFISAMGDVLDKVKAFSVGGVDYITKPFQVEEVLARLETHLTIRNLQQQLQQQNFQLRQKIQERRQVEEKFAKVFRASPSPIFITTLSEGRFVDINPSFLKMSGYSVEEVIGRTVAELKLGMHQPTYQQTAQGLLATDLPKNQECEFHTKSGEIRTILLSVEFIDLAGVPCTLNIVNDITERKRLENEFISLVSHELRTPLTSLMGSLDLLGSGQLGSLSNQGQKMLTIATTNTERLIRMVNDILDLERMKSGKITMQMLWCNAATLMTQATEAMQSMADQAKVTLLDRPQSVQLFADPDRILQTLTNLLNNAIKFSPPGGTVWLSADMQLSQASPPSPILLISVKDQGRGIPADKHQLIFERFQQVDTSDSRQKGGTGLGLAICRKIVEQHDGKIWVESSLGKGSTFYVQLPLRKQ